MLHSTGNISKYINQKYSFLSYSMIYVLFFLTIVEGIRWYFASKKNEMEHQHNCDCHHDHDHHHHGDREGTEKKFTKKKLKKSWGILLY